MLKLIPLPIFDDNYIWVLHDHRRALAVDPGLAAPLEDFLTASGLQLAALLVTHHHLDHTGGLAGLLASRPDLPVYGPARVAGVNRPLVGGETVSVLDHDFDVIPVPGHTLDHLAYYAAPWLFCGDTLFAAGCGRLFEGSATQMHASLTRLGALPADTLVCCTHEYTLSNLKFARAVEPANAELREREVVEQARRAQGLPTLPSNMALERATNPYLRCAEPGVIGAARHHGATDDTEPEVLAAIRRWKDHF
ncbi:hydroxyacylglutathione hydrolase [Jeongeupia naejangsanensis]|uniref:Hydroxyacylglutathione hydrolase n=1 Tax=Jeongeupia naejangsanensis TaxID=613195 RepID=A0ABS2BM59_9NEIS|nr:hydroxyacylglutathione hydrolase [Jeongeupia naejangsanensis]MBM3116688.1 hydroxyacylglutathione hydrolase [Jeongeupia naejangsanensis]